MIGFFQFLFTVMSPGLSPKSKLFPALLAPTLLFGCAQKTPFTSIAPDIKRKQPEIVRGLISHPPKITSLSAFAKVSISMEGKRRRVKEVILIDGSGNMRFETLSPFGQTSLLLIKRGSRVLFHNLMENSYMFLGAREAVLERVLGVPISLEHVRQVFFQDFSGATPEAGRGELVTEGDRFVVEYSDHFKKISLTEFGAIKSVQYLDTSRKIMFTVSYLKYEKKNKLLSPQKIEINFPLRGIELGFDFRELSINEPLDINSFSLSIPPTAQRLR